MAKQSNHPKAADRGMDRREFLVGSVGAGVAAALPSTRLAADVPPASGNARLFQRAFAFPPRAMHLFPSESWLQSVSAAGYSHVMLQVDPFFHPEMNIGDMNESEFYLLNTFDMAYGPMNQAYRSWLSAVSQAVSRHGLAFSLDLWQPRLSLWASRAVPEDWKGPALKEAEVTGGRLGYQPLCVSHPAARAWFLEGFRKVLASAPDLDAVLWGINDNEAYLCDDRCPRCHGRPFADRLGELFADSIAVARQVQPRFQLVVYDWNWYEESYYDAIFSKLPRGTPVVTKMEKGAPYVPDPEHPEWTGHVLDQSLGCDQVGTTFLHAKKLEAQYGSPVLVMITPAETFENWHTPYVPAVGQIARKFDKMRKQHVAGWMDFDCGGVHEGLILDLIRVVQHHPASSVEDWVKRLATERYGSESAAQTVVKAWALFDSAVRYFPQCLDYNAATQSWADSFGTSIALLPMHPFLPERAVKLAHGGDGLYWADPHNYIKPDALPPCRYLMAKMVRLGRQGLEEYAKLQQQTSGAHQQRADLDGVVAELAVLTWRSTANFYEWAAYVLGDKSVPIANILRDEIDVTRTFGKYLTRPELEIGNPVWAWQRQLAASVPEASTDNYKMNYVPAITLRASDFTECKVPGAVPSWVGDFTTWKIRGLEKQLAEL
jgi:hypothetical protein